MELIAKSEDELKEVVAELIPHLESKRILALYGAMGAGKTTLVSEIVKQLGGGSKASSPSYAIHHQYETNKGVLHHFDFYRIKSLSEAFDLGAEDLFSVEKCVL